MKARMIPVRQKTHCALRQTAGLRGFTFLQERQKKRTLESGRWDGADFDYYSEAHGARMGADIYQAIEFLRTALAERGFSGPDNLNEHCCFTFAATPCETIWIQLNFGRFSRDPNTGVGHFDSHIIVQSKTLYEKTFPADPWTKSGAIRETGLVTCYVDSLGHRKWAEQPTANNPAWLMTTSPDVHPNLTTWLSDFDRLHLPEIADLKSDDALIRKMQTIIDYRKPQWVLSDGPRFVWIRERLAALQRDVI